jgi:hypothetical protein
MFSGAKNSAGAAPATTLTERRAEEVEDAASTEVRGCLLGVGDE